MDEDRQHAYDHPPGGADGHGAECLACPICVVLQAVRTTSPEVVEHLAAAGRELALALQAAVAAAAAPTEEEPQPERVQHIRVD